MPKMAVKDIEISKPRKPVSRSTLQIRARVDLLGGRTVRRSASVNRPVTQLAGNELRGQRTGERESGWRDSWRACHMGVSVGLRAGKRSTGS